MKIDKNVVINFGLAVKSNGEATMNEIGTSVYENFHLDDGSFTLLVSETEYTGNSDSEIIAKSVRGSDSKFFGASIEVLGRAFIINEDLDILTQIDEEEDGEITTGVFFVTDEAVIKYIEDYLVLRTGLLEKSGI